MKRFTRALAFLLVFSMVLGYLPQNLVFASPQSGKNNLKIIVFGEDVHLSWSRPPKADMEDAHDTSFYDVFMRNTTMLETYPGSFENILDAESAEGEFSLDIPSGTFMKNSIYMLKVVPGHWHVPLGNNGVRQAVVPPNSEIQEVLYLSDMEISAVGSVSSLSVTWKEPFLESDRVFTHYTVYYGKEGSSGTNKYTDSRTFSVLDNPNVTINDATREITYTIDEDISLESGLSYVVKIEPMMAPNGVGTATEIRPSTNKIKVNGNEYPIAYSEKEYYTETIIRPRIKSVTEVNDMLRVEWESLTLDSDANPLMSVSIYMSTSKEFPEKPYAVFEGDFAKRLNYIDIPRPAGESTLYFKLVVEYENKGEVTSNIATYEPESTAYKAYKPEILKTEQVDDNTSISYDITWEAFSHPPYNDVESALAEAGLYYDDKMTYEIIITDNLDNFDNPSIASFAVRKNVEEDDDIELNWYPSEADKQTKAYTYTFDQYITLENRLLTRKDFEENKVYYVRIRAIRNNSNSISEAAYSSWYIYQGTLPTSPVMISKPPLHIKEKGKYDFTIQWDTQWFEVYDDKSSYKAWYTVIGVNENGDIVYGDEAEKLTDEKRKIRLSEIPDTIWMVDSGNREKTISNYIIDKLDGFMNESNSNPIVTVRQLDLTGSKYAIHVVPFDYMFNEGGGYDEYYKSLSFDSYTWQMPITPTGNPASPEFKVTQVDAPERTSLSNNTAYVVYFQPYIQDKDGNYLSQYPNYLVVTTNDDREPVEIDPTVPYLIPVSSTDVTATVKWKYSINLKDDVTYELRYSALIADYDSGGTLITSEVIKAAATQDKIINEKDKDGNDQPYLHFEITGLFPNTKYYFWIRSSTATGTSDYSNPVDLTTKDMVAPEAPQGLGLISTGNLEIYNAENDLEYLQTDYDYVIIEWLRNYDDFDDSGDTATGGNAGGGGLSEILSSSMFDVSYIVKFNQLIANRGYYVRVKTKLIVTAGNDGVSKSYSYIVQIADNEDFLDAYEIEVPPGSTATGNGKSLQKESEWCNFIKVYTRPSKGEYDGDKNDAMYPLPTNDFEITYDAATGTLTYRFRSNKTDQGGNKDNMVDQRLISSLIQTKAFSYYIDLSSYGDKAVQNRKIELPYSIVKAFDEMKINLEVIAGNLSVTFYPQWLQTPQVKALSDFGAASTVNIDISESASKITADIGGTYVSTPQQLSVNVATATRTQALDATANPIGVSLKLNNRYTTYDKNVLAYQYTDDAGSWQLQASNYDPLAGQTSFKTLQLGSYSAIAKNAPVATSGHYADEAMRNFSTKMTVTDMAVYNGNTAINGNRLNNLIAAIATAKKEFEIDGFLSPSETSALSKRKLIVETDNVTREQGIDALVKLYEIKMGSAIKSYSSMASTPYEDIITADSAYRNSLLKAGDLGFFADGAANPKASMTLGDAIYIADLILQDTF